MIHQTKGEILNQVQNDNRSETGTEVSTPIDVASSFNWTEEKVRPSKDGPYKPNRPERLDRRKKPERPDRPKRPDRPERPDKGVKMGKVIFLAFASFVISVNLCLGQQGLLKAEVKPSLIYNYGFHS